jgi:4-alpha-glucanotransferase
MPVMNSRRRGVQSLFFTRLLNNEKMNTNRGAGLLLHITSLSSPFGIGDLGPHAYSFAEFLHRAGQKYWQILPLSPIQTDQHYSPYSSVSSTAGNVLLISPELLMKDGLLSKSELQMKPSANRGTVEYDRVANVKSQLFKKAYNRMKAKKDTAFQAFCYREAYWLDDFALYMTLRQSLGDCPWYSWPEEYKFRDLKSLLKFTDDHQENISYEKWLQYQFFKQWKDLRRFCNDLNISIIGDLPFYISYDSVDVWSRQEIFKLNSKGEIEGIAGVPPDYFNDKGQLWGMPVYRWEILQETGYDWWIKRIRKNLELVDLLRLDHFRAFVDYWDVASGEKTAENGAWKPGPGADLFRVFQQEFGRLPFIAEDLGDINQAVHKMRDKFSLPGMKVLQFAFGNNLAGSEHIPHNFDLNFIVYTGTHDNNTTVGWFANELKKEHRGQLETYVGKKLKANSVSHEMIRLAYSSVARIVIIPVQDLLSLDGQARMNTPASTSGNWSWRLLTGQLSDSEERKLREWVAFYNRA